MKTNKLTAEDAQLFSYMEEHYVSENEKNFFRTIKNKQMQEPVNGDFEELLSKETNTDGIYLLRVAWEEYIIGHSPSSQEIHTMDLHDALQTNLHDAGFITEDLTLLEWLRRLDYEGVVLNNNKED